jgi:hypothetical protein
VAFTPFPIPWVPRTRSLGVKRPGLGADHLPVSGAEVKNEWGRAMAAAVIRRGGHAVAQLVEALR